MAHTVLATVAGSGFRVNFAGAASVSFAVACVHLVRIVGRACATCTSCRQG